MPSPPPHKPFLNALTQGLSPTTMRISHQNRKELVPCYHFRSNSAMQIIKQVQTRAHKDDVGANRHSFSDGAPVRRECI